MSIELLNKWSPQAWNLEGPVEDLRLPFHVLAGEALDVVRFAKRYWKEGIDESGKVVRPGLSSAVREGQFADNIAEEIREIHDALQAVQSKYRLAVDSVEAAPVGRAQFAIREMREVLRWYFDDGKVTQGDAQLEALAKAHDSAFSHDALAAALFDYAALAERHREAITGLGGFDGSIIDNAPKIALALRERSAGPESFEPPPDVRQMLELRNRLGMLMYERMQRVRTAAQFVFRGHTDIIRKATSAYGRQQRANHRRAQEENGVETADTLETPAVQPVATAPATSEPSGSTAVGLPGSNPFLSS